MKFIHWKMNKTKIHRLFSTVRNNETDRIYSSWLVDLSFTQYFFFFLEKSDLSLGFLDQNFCQRLVYWVRTIICRSNTLQHNRETNLHDVASFSADLTFLCFLSLMKKQPVSVPSWGVLPFIFLQPWRLELFSFASIIREKQDHFYRQLDNYFTDIWQNQNLQFIWKVSRRSLKCNCPLQQLL